MKKTVSIIVLIIFLFLCFEILTESKSIMNSVNFSLTIWKNNIFPSLFPFFVLSQIMIKYGVPEFIGILLKPFMNKLFKINSKAAFIFIGSIISGNPSNAKYTKELYLNGDLNKYEATKTLMFTCFANPLFILGTVSIMFLNSKLVGPLILFCHYIGNIIVGIIIRNYYPSKKEKNKLNLKQAINTMHKKRISNKENFGTIFTNSLTNSINTLFLILGVMTVCLIFTTIIDNNINLNSIIQSLLNGSIEMTQGLKYISLEDLPLKIKTVLSVMILSFGGFSIHLQIISILSDTDIKYFPFLCARIIHAAVSSILTFILFDFWINI